MKTRFLSTVRTILGDRQLLGFLALILAVTATYIVYVLISLRPTDVQVATHYSVFGDTHYYRNRWEYMLSFVAFGLVFATVHTGIILKLIREGFRPLAIAFAWLTLMIYIVVFVLTHSVLSVAFLS